MRTLRAESERPLLAREADACQRLGFYGRTRDLFDHLRSLFGLAKSRRNVTLRDDTHNLIVRINDRYAANLVGGHRIQGALQLIIR